MSLKESIVEDAALEWFGDLRYAGGRLNVSISEGAWTIGKESLAVPRRVARRPKP